MSAYIIASYDIVDAEGMKDYVPGVLPLLAKYDVEVLAADSGAQALEGEKRAAYVVLRFESEETALAFYNDPDYAPLRKMRIGCTANTNLVLAHEFVPPES